MKRLCCDGCGETMHVTFCYECNSSDHMILIEQDTAKDDTEYIMDCLRDKSSTIVHWSALYEMPAIIGQSEMTKFQILNMLSTTDFIINPLDMIADSEGKVISVVGISFTNVECDDDDGIEDVAFSAYIEV